MIAIPLPKNKLQCVHAELLFPNDEFIRCLSLATHGFLCEQHDAEVFSRRVFTGKPVPRVQVDQVGLILATEKRALSGAEREVYGLKHKVQMVKGQRLSKRVVLSEETLERLMSEAMTDL